MSLLRMARGCAFLVGVFLYGVALLSACGCRSASTHAELSGLPASQDHSTGQAADSTKKSASTLRESPVRHVSHEEAQPVDAAASDDSDPFASQAELSLPELIAEVQRRNPSLQASMAAWAAMAQRYPQVVALDDPVFQSMFAPASFASSSNVQSSYFVGISQKVPWSGKRELRGAMARNEEIAASLDTQEVRLRLSESCRLAFVEYYLVARQRTLNRAAINAVREFSRTANDRYIANQATLQDVLQAEVELAKLESRTIELDQAQRVSVARINALLHRRPDQALPPPPATLPTDEPLPPVETLRQLAIEQRPELAAQAARIQAEQANVSLACKDYYPDFELMGRYDQFWTDREQRPQVGMYVNIPLNQSRRGAAVREAAFRLQKMQAQYDEQVDAIQSDVQTAHAQLEGSRRIVGIYAEKILPKATDNVASATLGYTAGSVDFLRLIQAQRELLELQEKHQEAIAESHRRRAQLERAIGAGITAASH